MDKHSQVIELKKQGLSHRQIKKVTGLWLATISKIANRHNMGKNSSYTNLIKNAKDASTLWEVKLEEKITKKEEEWIHTISYEWWEIKTKEQFFDAINFEQDKFEILSLQTNLRPVVVRASRNETKLINKYEFLLRTKPVNNINIDRIINKLQTIKPLKPKNIPLFHSDKAFEICLFDAHINKLWVDKDRWLEKAKEVYIQWVQSLCHKALKNYEFYEEVVLVIGQDFFNSDSLSKTSAWTPQDNTNNEQETFEAWLDIIISAVEVIQDTINTKVRIISMPWNHSNLLEQILWIALNALYRNSDNVVVDYTKARRKYWKFGCNMVMFTHWDNTKKDQLPMLMATEEPQMRADCKYREIHHGHIHTQMLYELNWVIVRSLSSITTKDNRHDKMWYIGNIRWWQAFIRDKEKGNEVQFNFYI